MSALAWLDGLEGTVDAAALGEARALGGVAEAVSHLVEGRWIEADALLEHLSAHYRVPAFGLSGYAPDKAAVALLSYEQARRLKVLPLFVLEDRIYVAVADALDLRSLDHVRHLTGKSAQPVLSVGADLEAAIQRHFLSTEQAGLAMGAIADAAANTAGPAAQVTNLEDRQAPAVRLLDHLLDQAVQLRASDVHLEPFGKMVRLRYRIDGVLHEFPGPPPALYPALISRLKIACSLDITERRLPQDGRLTVRVDGRKHDLRVSIMPHLHGEGAVVRVLYSGDGMRDLAELGFEPAMLETWTRLARRPHGIVLVTGPTGSGKSTTLYATLGCLVSASRKVLTLEDPVEYELEGVNQMPVRADIGFSFACGLRAMLRHDPDVIMIGEMRDLESAEVAIRAALTGHLLFSTLHTNDAPQAVTRLLDMGVQSYKVLASLNAVLAQRLLRRLCTGCRQARPATAAQAASLGDPRLSEGMQLYAPVGCVSCGGLGYRGRVAVHELLEITAAMRRLQPDEVTAERLRSMARADGFVEMRAAAVRKLLDGVTSLDEVIAVSGD